MRICQILVLLMTFLSSSVFAEPIRLHPDNPHYFLFQNRPTILLTSAEHYGAVLNQDFDIIKYLDALDALDFNYTRAFSGAYREIPGSFNIERNTLAPAPGAYLCPWARSAEPGYALGGAKFDLTQWDPAYFARLRDFLTKAARRDIVVELTLFCPFYPQKKGDIDALFKASPLHVSNNVNGVGDCPREKVYTLDNGGLLAVQEAMVRRIVEELNGFDNLIYEICNEPYFGGVTDQWQAHIAGVIAETEKSLSNRHLISQNIANARKKIENPNPLVSIFNFHYANPATVTDNYALARALGDDETGFRGPAPEPYRVEAWQFLMAGGALYNNLDYTFTTASPAGGDTANHAPGSTTTEIRDQLVVLRRFFGGLDYIKMRPAPAAMVSTPANLTAHALTLEDKLIAAYFAVKIDKAGKPITPDSVSAPEKNASAAANPNAQISLTLPPGEWKADWISPLTGKLVKSDTITHPGGRRALRPPPFTLDLVLRLKRVSVFISG